MGEAESLGQHEGFAHADHADAEDHVVADLGGLAGTGISAMNDALAHVVEDGLGLGESLRRAADHEGERAGGSTVRAARHGGVERQAALAGEERMGLTRAVHVDRRAIDEERAGLHGGGEIVPDGDDVLAPPAAW